MPHEKNLLAKFNPYWECLCSSSGVRLCKNAHSSRALLNHEALKHLVCSNHTLNTNQQRLDLRLNIVLGLA